QYGTDVDFLYQASRNLVLVDEIQPPRLMRRIHPQNHSDSLEFIRYNPRLVMAWKWFKLAKVENFDVRINRILLYRLITRMYFSSGYEELSWIRYPIKIYYLIKILIFNSWILRKI